MNFGEILTRAWQIIWKYKVLWIFGILAGFGSSGSSNVQYSFSRRDNVPFSGMRFDQLTERFPAWQIALFVGIVILVILLFTILVIFLSTIGKIGLIKGTYQVEQGEEKLIFGELFSNSGRFFWRVFLLNLIVGLVVFVLVIMIILAYAFAAIATLGILGICLLPFICLLVPLGWLLNLVIQQAIVAIVVEDLGIGAGFQRGWEVFTKNIGTYLVMGLILFLISLVAGAILGLPALFILGPIAVGVLSGTQVIINSALIFGLVCCVLYLPVLLLGNGILTGFTNSVWTLTFLRLTGRTPEPPPADELAPADEPTPEPPAEAS